MAVSTNPVLHFEQAMRHEQMAQACCFHDNMRRETCQDPEMQGLRSGQSGRGGSGYRAASFGFGAFVAAIRTLTPGEAQDASRRAKERSTEARAERAPGRSPLAAHLVLDWG